ncbi:4'-phosphopantetheinyl transferase family protein [Methylogaea oryzae]|uniref:4'-phosphopantetheinyl transferase n=1 Tax=Methylogaea oryzae TaxID=1295382 RepID=A0A8D4VR94_9GAMM|nr:4'-phosphopantetheinyl transferase superfamily protein [Methylogaea oryzae]BBL72366.1 4'-phosphopantetheinyl transferase [Methylogaea oryzae]
MIRSPGAAATVWRLPLLDAPDDGYLLAQLEPAERRRATQYRNDSARRRFLVCRAALRRLLAERLGTDAAVLRLIADDHGKPHLADSPAGLSFNVSHTDGLALIALGDGRPLGVDVEVFRPARALDGIARRCFSAQEFAHWQALPPERRTAAFYTLWTRKEAFAKAVGKGIAIGLERIVFDADGALSAVPAECGRTADWRVLDLAAGAGYSAALAMGGPPGAVEMRDWAGFRH